ncbi:hypothetical protein PRIPAC_71546 [Pristionchus pacificus]|uniref:Nuclear receptor n=1 Tax=Pristionchus pacificus TaxID=54126 RepID=A0A8R1UNX5_PRIPA|nr:hypothetical protein PRIPAC_71546 [Pristionchus pacificus]
MDTPMTSPEGSLVDAKDARRCKICDGRAAGAHFGVDSCRACAAFFRRTLISKRKFECNSGGCRKPRDCKKCRFDRCTAAGMLPTLVLRNKSLDQEGSPPIPNVLTSHPDIILLHRLMANYKDFTRERLYFEQEFYSMQNDALPSNSQLTPSDEPQFTVYVAKFDQINGIYRGVAERAMKYLMSSFEEMYGMNEQDRFTILQNFIFLICHGEGHYRAAKTFKERPMESYFMTYTSSHRFSEFEEFFRDSEATATKQTSHVSEKCYEINVQTRDMLVPILDRMALTEIEFVALMCIALWTLTSSERIDPQMSKIGDSYRKRVFEELHVLYRDEFKLDNYATRLGELMTLTNAVQMSVSSVITELQFLNVFDVFQKDSFTSMIVRKTVIKEEPMF